MAKRQAYSAARQTVGGNSSNHIQSDLDKLNTSGKPPELQRAVVLEVIADPGALTEDELDDIAEQVNNSELVDVMPCNSIMARIVSNNSAGTAKPNTILYPFFSSHVMLPVKAGETVYVIYEDYQGSGGMLGYWLTRIHSDKTVEDVNYTHFDRRFDASNNPTNYSTEEISRLNKEGSSIEGPNFPNGGNTRESLSLEYDDRAERKIEPFEQIKKESKTYSNEIIEPVPRWKKRPSELVFQGSNNTLVFFGRDRSSGIFNDDDSKEQAGMVGVIVGRGRTTANKEESGVNPPSETNPRVIKNSRGEFETDKAPHRRGFQRKDNPNEGNPDFKNDASMFYLSMQTEADRKFGIQLNSAGSLGLPAIDGKQGTFNRAYAIGKSDHIRLVSRKDDENGVKGTILLLREGQENEDLGYFFIDEEGRIQIESKKVYLGKSTEETEPYIKWTEYKKSIDGLQAQIDKIAGACSLALGNIGAPIPSLATVQGQITPDKLSVSKAVTDARSNKIFGE